MEDPSFQLRPDPANPGWRVIEAGRTGRFLDLFGDIRLKAEGDSRGRMRLFPAERHLNIIDTVHGGFLLAVADQALFLVPALLGIEGAVGGQTIAVSTQFFAPAVAGKPLDAVVDVLRVTHRMVFLRGLIEQDGEAKADFSGTFKRASRRQ